VADLDRADAAWLVSSVRLAAGIIELDGRPMPYDADETRELNEYLLSPRD
jgi:4-amino-4-deoxychorismate lyase